MTEIIKTIPKKPPTLVDQVVKRVASLRNLGESVSIVLHRKDRPKLSYRIRTMNEEGPAFYYTMKNEGEVVTITLAYKVNEGWFNDRRPHRLQGGPRL